MSDAVEVVIASDASGQHCTFCVWDVRNGSQLMTYKGGSCCGPKSLAMVGNDYFVGAELSKPVLHVWPINKGDPKQELRTIVSGVIRCLAVSPDGKYLIAGIAEKLHVWLVESGRLLAVAVRHFQNVTCIKFIEDGSHFVSGGEDGMVLIWSLARLIAKDSASPDPVYSFSDHYMEVKDLFVGYGGNYCRIVSVSTDGTCKIYDFSSGKLLLSVMVESNLTAVTWDVCESSLFIGTLVGDILTVDIRDPPRSLEVHLPEKVKENVFRGHSKAVTCLSVSQDTTSLLSGSADETVRLWHILSKQCLRTFQLKGPVTNAFITILPTQCFAEKLQPSVVMHRLQRSHDVSDSDEICVEMLITSDAEHLSISNSGLDTDYHLAHETSESSVNGISGDYAQEINDLKKKNAELFKFCTNKLLSQISDTEAAPNLIDVSLALKDIDSLELTPGPIPGLKKSINKPIKSKKKRFRK